MSTRPLHLLTIAGSDSGGGAGIQADLKTFVDHGVFGMSVITAITAQSPSRVTRVDPVPVDGVVAQLETVFADLPVDGVKIGMLGTAEHVLAVASVLAALPSRPPIVLDTVMVASSGARLLEPAAEAALREHLLPLATIATPNLPEIAVLAGSERRADWVTWARQQHTAILITGGDAHDDVLLDEFITPKGSQCWTAPRVPGGSRHGTGCTLSSALAAQLAMGVALPLACERAIRYTQRLVRHATGAQLPHGLI